MKLLAVLDKKDYSENAPVIEMHTVRAIIRKNGRIATQKSAAGEYKLLGGGMEKGEDEFETLAREVREEGGMVVIPESIRPVGEILEMHEDIFQKGHKYVCRSGFYFCDVTDERLELQMAAGEIAKGCYLCWAEPEEIIEGNRRFADRSWIYRDALIIELLLKGEI